MGTWKRFFDWYRKHEGPAWTFTFAWIGLVVGALKQWSAKYDPTFRLDIHDWSSIATITSGIVAPLAVLWVVRSFYVQKSELAAAVSAAAEQAAALKEQTDLAMMEFKRAITPTLTWDIKPHALKPAPNDGVVAVLGLQAKNVGHGAAHEVHATAYAYFPPERECFRKEARVSETLLMNDVSSDCRFEWNASLGRDSTWFVYLELRYRDATGERHIKYVRVRVGPEFSYTKTMSESRFQADMDVLESAGEPLLED